MATIDVGYLVPPLTTVPSNRQRIFTWYLAAVLIDLVVLNLLEQYWDRVEIESFSVSLLVAVLLQILLKVTIAMERRVAAFFMDKPGVLMKLLRLLCAWLVLFGSKFVILEAIDFAFGHDVDFHGPFDGLGTLIVIIVLMLAAEQAMVRLYRRLA